MQLCQPLLALARSRSHLVSPPAPRLGSLLPASAKSLPREQTGAGPARAPLPALLFLCYFFPSFFFFFFCHCLGLGFIGPNLCAPACLWV